MGGKSHNGGGLRTMNCVSESSSSGLLLSLLRSAPMNCADTHDTSKESRKIVCSVMAKLTEAELEGWSSSISRVRCFVHHQVFS